MPYYESLPPPDLDPQTRLEWWQRERIARAQVEALEQQTKAIKEAEAASRDAQRAAQAKRSAEERIARNYQIVREQQEEVQRIAAIREESNRLVEEFEQSLIDAGREDVVFKARILYEEEKRIRQEEAAIKQKNLNMLGWAFVIVLFSLAFLVLLR
jgi:hypothetical protein